ncbi:low molecular weight protein-tyrosine-phosphatase [Niallia sp. 01092]|uniref:low molecular weight protein-tyrosine-phosphatase n=1 Tax=unclassified Niallia TaxID=2837522 RepID=UPI003FD023AE
MKVKVLFICLGNICRSPMAEAIFRNLVKKEGLEDKISCDSAGTGGWHVGNPPHKGTRHILKQNNISEKGIVARQFIKEDFEQFDYLIAMDPTNIENMKKLSADPTAKARLLLDYTEQNKGKEVPDPYYTGNFEEVYGLVTEGCEALLQEIKTTYHF